MSRFKAVALDMMGVVYSAGDDLREIVIPYLKERGCLESDDEIVAAYRSCYREGASARSFWETLGFDPPHDAIEEGLLSRYELMPGAVLFLETMVSEAIPVFSLSNDVAEWATMRRQRFGLESYFRGCVVSGECKISKPQAGIYRILAQMLPCSTSECIFVDDREANLDGALTKGFRTALFGAEAHSAHATVKDFGELIRLVT
ncbi:MAG: HAD-IA family hydrolase [Dehalococcoidia bacterium]|nr:HAD-IA family hydrolase [Dehalococcoidia bacterium]